MPLSAFSSASAASDIRDAAWASWVAPRSLHLDPVGMQAQSFTYSYAVIFNAVGAASVAVTRGLTLFETQTRFAIVASDVTWDRR